MATSLSIGLQQAATCLYRSKVQPARLAPRLGQLSMVERVVTFAIMVLPTGDRHQHWPTNKHQLSSTYQRNSITYGAVVYDIRAIAPTSSLSSAIASGMATLTEYLFICKSATSAAMRPGAIERWKVCHKCSNETRSASRFSLEVWRTSSAGKSATSAAMRLVPP